MSKINLTSNAPKSIIDSIEAMLANNIRLNNVYDGDRVVAVINEASKYFKDDLALLNYIKDSTKDMNRTLMNMCSMRKNGVDPKTVIYGTLGLNLDKGELYYDDKIIAKLDDNSKKISDAAKISVLLISAGIDKKALDDKANETDGNVVNVYTSDDSKSDMEILAHILSTGGDVYYFCIDDVIISGFVASSKADADEHKVALDIVAKNADTPSGVYRDINAIAYINENDLNPNDLTVLGVDGFKYLIDYKTKSLRNYDTSDVIYTITDDAISSIDDIVAVLTAYAENMVDSYFAGDDTDGDDDDSDSDDDDDNNTRRYDKRCHDDDPSLDDDNPCRDCFCDCSTCHIYREALNATLDYPGI